MTKITANPDGTFTLAAGSYVLGGISGDDGLYAITHPDADFEIYVPPVETTSVETDFQESGLDILMLPFGADRHGVRSRTVQVDKYAFIGGYGLFISPVAGTDYSLEDCFSASSDIGSIVTFDTDVSVVLDGTTVRIGDIVLDSLRPGYYRTGDIVVDFNEPGLAEALGYDEDAEFDEHGLRIYVTAGDERINQLRALGTPTALALAQEAEDDMIGCLYYSRDQLEPRDEVRKAA